MKPIDEKISAFVKRYVKAIPDADIDEACERNLHRLQAKLEAAREAARITQEETAQELRKTEEKLQKIKPFESLVLAAVHSLHEDGYTLTIHQKVNQASDKETDLTSIYTTLDRLEERGLVKSRLGDPTPERGGHPKRFYTVTAAGEATLANAGQSEEPRPIRVIRTIRS